jgi:hypothetical protein
VNPSSHVLTSPVAHDSSSAAKQSRTDGTSRCSNCSQNCCASSPSNNSTYFLGCLFRRIICCRNIVSSRCDANGLSYPTCIRNYIFRSAWNMGFGVIAILRHLLALIKSRSSSVHSAVGKSRLTWNLGVSRLRIRIQSLFLQLPKAVRILCGTDIPRNIFVPFRCIGWGPRTIGCVFIAYYWSRICRIFLVAVEPIVARFSIRNQSLSFRRPYLVSFLLRPDVSRIVVSCRSSRKSIIVLPLLFGTHIVRRRLLFLSLLQTPVAVRIVRCAHIIRHILEAVGSSGGSTTAV